MWYRILCMAVVTLMGWVINAQAADRPSLPASQEVLQGLSKHPQWQHLLFYKDGKGEVISPNFYLTMPLGGKRLNIDPYQELLYTLQHRDDVRTVCRYPARFFWLKKQLPELSIDLSHCPNHIQDTQQMSMILVSSYLKNPASTFGHVLIKTDAKPNEPSAHLLSDSYNFGASIPANENGVMYALKGLFGRYQASFAKADFFTQDAVYSQNEQRDMWEYVLNLDEFSQKLLSYHLQEASQAKFSYYFIKQNCGYRSGELLELISDLKTTERVGGWYAPEFVFDTLMRDKSDLVAHVRYIPSEQTQVRELFVQLPADAQQVVNAFIDKEDMALIEHLDEQNQSLVLDFLIKHRNYKLAQKNTPHHQAIKKALTAKRLTLPAGSQLTKMTITAKVPPHQSNRTTKTYVSVEQHQANLGVIMFAKDPLDTNTELDKRFVAMDTQLSYHTQQHLSLSKLTLLDIEQIEDIGQPLFGEPRLSWRLKAGIQNQPNDEKQHQVYVSAGLGVGMYVGKSKNKLLYGFGDVMVHDDHQHLDGQVQFGFRMKKDSMALELSQTVATYHKDVYGSTSATIRQQLSDNQDVRLQLTHHLSSDKDNQAKLTWHYYW